MSTPWAAPEHDVMADIREAMKLLDRMPPRRTLHCAPDVIDALVQVVLSPSSWLPFDVMSVWAGIDMIPEADWEHGRWELREDDAVIDSGVLRA